MWQIAAALAAAPELAGPDGSLDRERLVEAVFASNAELAWSDAEAGLAAAQVGAAGAVPDPMLDLEAAPLSFGMEEPGWRVGLSQELPLWGMRRNEKAMAAAGADAATARAAMMRRDMGRMASMAWVDWWMMHRELRLTEEAQLFADQARDAALRRYATGRGDSPETLALSAESSMLLAMRRGMEAEVDLVRARINNLLHREADSALPPPPPSLPAPPPPGPAEASPEADEAEAMARMAAAGLSMARRASLPMIGWMAGWDAMEEMLDHRLMLGLSVELPLAVRSRAGGVAAAEAEARRVDAERAAMLDRLALARAEARIRRDGARAQLELLRREVLPAAEARVAATRAAFATGSSSVQALLDAERFLRETRIEAVRVEAEWQIQSLELAWVTR